MPQTNKSTTGPPEWIVVQNREGDTEAYPFDDLVEAGKFYDKASAQWSDTYLCKIIEGPQV